MPKAKTVTRSLTVAGLVEALAGRGREVTTGTLYRHANDGAPHERRQGRIYFAVDEYLAWCEARNLTGERGRPEPDDSPDMEAAKLAKERAVARIKEVEAERQERRRDIERGTHQDLEHEREMLTQFGALLKSGIERMQRRFGADAAVMFNEMLDEYDALVRKHTGRLGDRSGLGAGQAAAQPA